ncbi:MAG: lipoate--protein ligase family protein [Leptospiraceae bacterium]|nr:lipoate--protein ligase family protein [Leptospiraceae bacterium]MCP5496155.1 lipoate--protein ligase family protein [Leptospiraceae bacterium]
MNQTIFILDQGSSRNIYYNLAIEEAYSLHFIKEGCVGGIRFWMNSNSVVLGLSEDVETNVPSEKLLNFQNNFLNLQVSIKPIKNNLYIARRCSGGGTVYQDMGLNLNYSLFVSTKYKTELYPIKQSYQILLPLVINALSKQGIEARMGGSSDIIIPSNDVLKKISGNSQFRKKDTLTLHGTLILNESLIPSITKNVKHPPTEPDYRQKREHKDFLSSLPGNFSESKFKKDLVINFINYMDSEELNKKKQFSFIKKILKEAKILYKEKYANLEYVLKR